MFGIPPEFLPRIRLLVPANISHNSGGNVYNSRLARELAALGAHVEVLPVEGSWPAANAKERRRFGKLLGARDAGFPSETVTIVDGLMACGAPDELEYSAGQRIWILLHMPPAGHPDREKRALRAAAGVICASSAAAAYLSRQHGIHGVHVALPGTDQAPVAAGSRPPHLVAVAALLPNKNQLLTLSALARLKDLPWTAALIGSDSPDPEYAQLIRDAIESHGLQGRVRVTGELSGEALEPEWQAADLSLLVSQAEAFGLVVTESIAHSVPAVVSAGTGAVEALELAGRRRGGGDQPLPGAAVVLDADAAALEQVLRRWLTDPAVRHDWRAAALAAREYLPRWDTTARTILDIVAGRNWEASAAGRLGVSLADTP